MSYKDDFKTRNKRMLAEEKCVAFLNERNILLTRYGFAALFDIPWQKFNTIPEVLRNTPDYMVFHTKATLLEAKGCYDILRLKQSDMKSYDWWVKICPLSMFIYCSKNAKHKLVSYEDLKALALKCETDIYPENNKVYYKIPWELIGGQYE